MKRYIGAHVSASGGPSLAVARAHEIGADAVQIFSGSPRVWKRSSLSEIEREKFYSEKDKYNLGPTLIHSLYLVNLVAESPELKQKSQVALAFDLAYGSALKAIGVVVHLGSHQGRGWEQVRDQLAADLKILLSQAPAGARLLIENSAGQSGKLCSDLHEVRWLLDTVNSPQLGWCLDTCHAFAAGYYLGEQAPEELPAKDHLSVRSLQAEIEKLQLWDSLVSVHVNDSRDPFASGRDRHENIGDGMIATDDLRFFLSLPQLTTTPLFLEVPGIAGKGPDEENVRRLRTLTGVTTR